MNKILRLSLAFAALFYCCSIHSQQKNLWSKSTGTAKNILIKAPHTPAYFKLALSDFKNQVNWNSKSTNLQALKTSNVIVSFPTSAHNIEQFRVEDYSVLSKELSVKFPAIKSYKGISLSNPLVQIYFSVDSQGFHGLIKDRQRGKTTYINPVKDQSETYYLVDKQNLNNLNFSCRVQGDQTLAATAAKSNLMMRPVDDSTLRTYRLALACSAEYAQFHIQQSNLTTATDTEKKEAVLSAMNTTITRVNSIYENDLAIRLELIDNNEDLIFLDPESDGLTNNNSETIVNNEIQNLIDSAIGTSNYDIGHVFTKTSSGGDGIAQLASVCTSNKARGVTGFYMPMGDSFDIDFVAHEMGHQFGATHTFNNSCNANRTTSTAVEPGSGSTIMSYAGICPDNVQGNSDAYFHAISISQIWDNILYGNSGCASTTTLNNQAPVISGLSNYTIPAGTAFVLEGSATDLEGDILTYNWEQQNNEVAVQPPVADSKGGPLFRSHPPSLSSKRFFPSAAALLTNNLSPTWEVIPEVARDLNFSLLVRDNNPEGGQIARSDLMVTTIDTGEAFEVTSQNTAQSLTGGAVYTVNWNVAHTNELPIQSDFVNLYLILNADFETPVLLKEDAKNDGSTQVVIPGDINSTNARIMVKAANNIFFSINKAVLAVNPANFALIFDNLEFQICQPENLDIPFSFKTYQGYNENITFSTIDVPQGLTVGFSQNQASESDTDITINISGSGNLASGYNTFTVVAESASGERKEYPIELSVYASFMEDVTLNAPIDQALDVQIQSVLSWEPYPNASQFEVQLSTAEDFNTIVASGLVNSTQYAAQNLEPTTQYYWRVKPINTCGEGDFSNAFSFTTVNISCNTITNNSSVSISPNGPSTVSSTIDFLEAGSINQINVTVDITHSWIEDLSISLISPSGTEVPLLIKQCGNNEDINATFTDQGNALSCSFQGPTISGQVLPEQPLSVLNGEPSKGIWQLKVEDSNNHDGGTINAFELNLCISGDFIADSDQDGVLDTVDQCPNTPPGSTVNVHGCEIFTIAQDNFKLSLTAESCIDQDDGSIEIEVIDNNYDYTATLTGNQTNLSANFNQSSQFNSLAAGRYELCFTIAQNPEYQQCFELIISQPELLSVYAKQLDGDKISVELTGADIYTIALNGTEFKTNRNLLELNLEQGINRLSISTDKDCQGMYEKTFITADTFIAYPNPFHNTVQLQTSFTDTDFKISVYDLSGRSRLRLETRSDNNGKIALDAGGLSAGVYMLSAENESITKVVKLIKR